jgi:UPF0176 protein
LADSTTPVVVAALYRFVRLPDYRELRETLLEKCLSLDLKGTLLLAPEGINGTVAGKRHAIDHLRTRLWGDARFRDMEYKESLATEVPFYRMKVKLKKEIVTLGAPEADPTRRVGTYVNPADWNALISDPEVLVVDTRNDYEVLVGTFRRAMNPQTGSFREFPAFVRENLSPEKHKKVAMFCTGGIRCEKATSLLLAEGFDDIYQLKGGILKYLETVPASDSLWDGECFVFDQRVSVTHGLAKGQFQLCYGCRHPLPPEDQKSPRFETGVSCPHCDADLSDSRRARARERQQQIELANARGQPHLGPRTWTAPTQQNNTARDQ